MARRSYRDYVVHVHHGNYTHLRHTEYIAERLEPIAHGRQKYMLIEIPPRHGNSMTVSESFPSYYLGKNPNKRVIAASYSDGLARKFERLNWAKLEEYGPDIFGVELSQINASQNNWDIAENLNRASVYVKSRPCARHNSRHTIMLHTLNDEITIERVLAVFL